MVPLTVLAAGLALALAALPAWGQSATASKRYALWDDKPAALDLKGWENHSFPLGNGYFGVSFFGGVSEELWQFSEKSVFVRDSKSAEDAWDRVALSGMVELRLVQSHEAGRVSGYRREVDLERAVGRTSYTLDGVTYTREAFTSYPDRCFAARLTASQGGRLSFTLKGRHPYLGTYRTGTATADGQTLVLRGDTLPYGLKYEVRIRVETSGGTVSLSAAGAEGEVTVTGADDATVYVTLGTNYRLAPERFRGPNFDPAKLAGQTVASEVIAADLARASAAGWDVLLRRHQDDVAALFRRATVDLGGVDPGLPTDRLLAALKGPPATRPTTAPAAPSVPPAEPLSPQATRYLEELYFQFGRYLLIASSRKGTLPAHLQGTWNMPEKAPWTGGVWANINVQMNYAPAFSTGLEETFEPYYEFFKATFPQQQYLAQVTARKWADKTLVGGWTAGTGNSPYTAGGPAHTSGAGTGPFVLIPLRDWYLFTQDPAVLEKIWPFALESSRFLSAFLKEQPDGTLLCDPSWSPENRESASEPHTNLPGTAYDQQLVYESHRITLAVAGLLNKTDPLLATLEQQLPRLSPVLVGTSGQIKEFRQENAYGDVGDPKHRHISQLVGLYPGTIISERPEWLAAARVTLDKRGDKSTGWGMAFRLSLWTRIKDAERAHVLLTSLLRQCTLPNLWDTHPPFQIDGNLGATAAMAEMLLQSHEGFLRPLAALPSAWPAGSFTGLRARGGYVVSAEWREGRLTRLTVTAATARPCSLLLPDPTGWTVRDGEGRAVAAGADPARPHLLTFVPTPNTTYTLTPPAR